MGCNPWERKRGEPAPPRATGSTGLWCQPGCVPETNRDPAPWGDPGIQLPIMNSGIQLPMGIQGSSSPWGIQDSGIQRSSSPRRIQGRSGCPTPLGQASPSAPSLQSFGACSPRRLMAKPGAAASDK